MKAKDNENKITSIDELKKVAAAGPVMLYGAGLRLVSFIEIVQELAFPIQIRCVLVSSRKGNPGTRCGLPVRTVTETMLTT